MAQLATTGRLDSAREQDFDIVLYPGGHGPLWALAEDAASIELIGSFLAAIKPIALVCHAPGVLRHVKGADGRSIVDGKCVTGSTNNETAAVGLTDIVPFLVEDELVTKGGRFDRTDDWGSYVVMDGLLTTGQNPTSSSAAAKRLMEQLAK